MKYILLLLLCCSCAGIQPSGGFFGNPAGDNAAQAGQAAANAGNAAANHVHHHTPPPMAAPGF